MPKIITQIEIKRKRKKSAQDIRRPVDDLPEWDDPVRRRLQSEGKFLNVYDVARNAGGSDRQFTSYLDASYVNGPYYDPFSSNGLFGGRGAIFWFIDAEDIDSTSVWNAYVMPGGHPDALPSSRMRITDVLPAYGITFNNLPAPTPGRGIEIPEELIRYSGPTGSSTGIQWEMLGQPLFPFWIDRGVVSSPLVAQKVTALPNFEAPSVTLTVDKSIDVFLAPGLYASSAHSRDAPFVEPPFPYLPQTWFWHFTVSKSIPRADFFGSADFQTIWAAVLNNTLNTSAPSATKDLYWEYFQREGNTYSTTATVHVHPGYTLQPGGFSGGGSVERYPDHNNRVSTFSTGYGPGSLMAMIRKHLDGGEFEWYYVWVAPATVFRGLNPNIVGSGTQMMFDY